MLRSWGLAHPLVSPVEGYVPAQHLGRIEQRFGLISDESGVVVLRSVTITSAMTTKIVAPAAVAADLAESPAARERSAGRTALTRLLEEFRSA